MSGVAGVNIQWYREVPLRLSARGGLSIGVKPIMNHHIHRHRVVSGSRGLPLHGSHRVLGQCVQLCPSAFRDLSVLDDAAAVDGSLDIHLDFARELLIHTGWDARFEAGRRASRYYAVAFVMMQNMQTPEQRYVTRDCGNAAGDFFENRRTLGLHFHLNAERFRLRR
jgi:hypothetical protein